LIINISWFSANIPFPLINTIQRPRQLAEILAYTTDGKMMYLRQLPKSPFHIRAPSKKSRKMAQRAGFKEQADTLQVDQKYNIDSSI